MTDEYTERKIDAIDALYGDLCEVLTGHGSVVQGGALADLVATWLAGHTAENAAETHALREELLKNYIEIVRALIPPNARRLGLTE